MSIIYQQLFILNAMALVPVHDIRNSNGDLTKGVDTVILKNLFSEKKIGTLTLKNRVILPAMGTSMVNVDGTVTQQLIDYHVARANGGCGLNIVEVAAIHPTSKTPGFLAIDDDSCVEGLTNLTSAIHEAGGKAAVQLWHGGVVAPMAAQGYEKVAPIDMPGYAKGLTIEGIKEIQEAYVDAVIRAQNSGFDAVELHFGHGYLPAEFLSPTMNYRQDAYGGSLENRMRFSLEIMEKVRVRMGKDYPVLVRISATEEMENGFDLEDMKIFSRALEAAGADAIHVSIGTPQGNSLKFEVPPVDLPVGFNVPNAAAIKAGINIPVVAVGRINDPIFAEKVLDESKADFIAVGRGQLGDPEFCNKAMHGDFDKIVKCIGCDQGCFDQFMIPGEFISCLRNPACGRESSYQLEQAEDKKKVLVAGGGPGGLEAATVLKKRGHDVILCEQSSGLGGQLWLAGVAPRKEELQTAALQMGKIAKDAGVEIRLQTRVTEEVVDQIKPDEVILAVGSEPVMLPIPGIEKPYVVSSHDVLKGLATTGNKVLVIGGGLVGAEIAELCVEQNKEVTIVELMDEVAKDLGLLRKICVMESLHKHGIRMITDAKCTEIKDGSVAIEKDGRVEEIADIDSVVIAVGARSKNTDDLVTYCKANDIGCHIIGDAVKARRALDAVWEGARIAREI